jgi:hypothetical protein
MIGWRRRGPSGNQALAAKSYSRHVEAMSSKLRPLEPAAAPQSPEGPTPAKHPLPPAAERALAEAAARWAERDRRPADPAKEIGGRDGPEPTRYGDWEINGLTSDF